MEATVDPYPRGPDWMPITPKTGSLFHAETQYLFNQAIWHGAAIVRDDAHASLVRAEGRKAVLYTLEEIGRLLSSYPDIAQVKISFPGAAVTEIRCTSVDKGQIGRMFRQGLELLAVEYGLSQRDYHKRRKIEQAELA